MLLSPPHDGVIEAVLSPPVRIPQRENVFSAGLFPRVSHFPRASQRRCWTRGRADRMANAQTQAIASTREPHRCRRLRELGALKQLLTPTRVGNRHWPNDSDCGMQGTLASVCTLLVIQGRRRALSTPSRRAALKTLHVGHSKAGACGA